MTTNTKCPQCSKTFATVFEMRQHFNDAHRKGGPDFSAVPLATTIDGRVPTLRCGNCRYYGMANGGPACRAHPGVGAMIQGPAGQPVAISLYPTVNENDWCGEWAAQTPIASLTPPL